MAQLGGEGPKRIRKFFKTVRVERTPDGFSLLLDGKLARTPARAPLSLPNAPLAEALAEEWRVEGESLEPAAMALTQLAFTAIDISQKERVRRNEDVVNYLYTELLCHRVDAPAALVERQSAAWDPILDWAAGAFGERFSVTTGVRAIEQPSKAIDSARREIEAMDAWRSAGLAVAVSVAGSALIGLALEARAFPADALFSASRVDEHFQTERWGVDAAAAARERRLEAAFMAVDKWFTLL